LTAPKPALAAVDELLVTATRREQSVQDVPYNISAYSSDVLERSKITDFAEFARLVPGMSFLDQGPDVRGNVNTFILRGLNGNPTSGNASTPTITVAPVSTYIGETPVFFSLALSDIERVEVLRGPQGTLYGSGATGGTIRFIPKAPDTEEFYAELDGDVSLSEESDETNYGVGGVVNVPLSDRMALRVVASYDHLGGFIDANGLLALDASGAPLLADPGDIIGSPPILLPQKEDANDSDSWSVRTSLRWDVTDSIDAQFTYLHQDDDVDNRQAHNPDFSGDGFFPPNDEYEQSFKIEEPYERNVDLYNLDVHVDFGFATLTSASSYYDNDSFAVNDISGFIEQFLFAYYYFFPRLTNPSMDATEEKGFVQELRLASNGENRIDWLAGVYYQDGKNRYVSDEPVPGIREYYVALLAFDPGSDTALLIDRTIDTRDIALFGELTYHITDVWQVTAGARGFWQQFKQNVLQQLPVCGSFCANDGVDPLGSTTGFNKQNFQDEIYKINTSYDLTENLMAYFTWSQGFRRGGANALPTAGAFAESPDLFIYRSDKANNFEVGLKGTLFDTVSFALAGYYIKWKDFQFDDFAPVSGLQFVANANDARSLGAEFEASANLTDNLFTSFGYSYTDAKLTEDFALEDPAIEPNSTFGFDGDRLPGIPKHSLTVSADYTQPIANSLDMIFHVNGSYRSKTNSHYNELTNLGRRFFVMDGFSIWDASVSLAQENWMLSLFVDNIGNEKGVTGGVTADNFTERGAYFFVTRPRTVGLRLRLNSSGLF